jgi:virginiamycin B lyase
VLTRTAVGEPGAGPYAVAVDAAGVAWITLVHSGQVARLTPDGPPELHDLGNPAARPSLLAVGPDGAVWVTRGGDDRIDRVDGDRRTFEVSGGPFGIAAGPEGGIWFTAAGADAVGRLAPDGEVTLTPVPGTSGMPAMIAAGPDGAMWFTLNREAALGRVDAAGEVTVHPLPDPACGPVGIAADGEALWFAEIGAGRVGRLVPGGPLRSSTCPTAPLARTPSRRTGPAGAGSRCGPRAPSPISTNGARSRRCTTWVRGRNRTGWPLPRTVRCSSRARAATWSRCAVNQQS